MRRLCRLKADSHRVRLPTLGQVAETILDTFLETSFTNIFPFANTADICVNTLEIHLNTKCKCGVDKCVLDPDSKRTSVPSTYKRVMEGLKLWLQGRNKCQLFSS